MTREDAQDPEEPQDAAEAAAEGKPEAEDAAAAGDGEEEEGLGDVEISPKLAAGIVIGLVVAIVAGFLIYDSMTRSALSDLVEAFKGYHAESAALADPRPRVPAQPSIEGDARDHYQRCLDSLSDDELAKTADFVNLCDAGEADSAAFVAFAQRIAEPLGMLREAVRSTRMSPWVDFRQGATAIKTAPYINLSLVLRALLNYSLWLRAQGQTAEAVALCSLSLQVAHDLCRGGPLAGLEYWRAVIDHACLVLAYSSSGSMDSAERAAAIQDLQNAERGLFSFAELVVGEHWLWEYQAASEAGADIEGLPERAVDLFERTVLAENWQAFKDFYAQATPLASQPLTESLAALRALEEKFKATNTTMPPLSSAMAARAVGAVKIRLLRIAQQLYQFEEKHGSMPASLAELGLSAAELADPFSSGALVYRAPAENQRPLLYSVGSDGEDNDGRVVDGDNQLLHDARGADIVLVVYKSAD